jgi:TetR/AcrR family transcriptional repressor of nem operon
MSNTIQKKTTREKLLEATFEEVYQNGYHGTGLSQILKRANINKGSLYHLFGSKKELMLAVIYEIIQPRIHNKYSSILAQEHNILESMFAMLLGNQSYDFIRGCPLNNLVQELSPVDKDFQTALEQVYAHFEDIMEQIVRKAMQKDALQVEDPNAFAIFLVATIEGAISSGKKSQNKLHYDTVIKQLQQLIQNHQKHS